MRFIQSVAGGLAGSQAEGVGVDALVLRGVLTLPPKGERTGFPLAACKRRVSRPRPGTEEGSAVTAPLRAPGSWTVTVAAILTALFLAAPVSANGGTIRVGSQPAGPFEVTVFTSPTPLEVGKADVSVAVQRAGTNDMVLNAQVSVVAEPMGQQGAGGTFVATHEQATNKLLYAANVRLPSAGLWRFTVDVRSDLGAGSVAFEAEASEPSLLSNPALLLLAVPPAALGLWWLSRTRRRAKS